MKRFVKRMTRAGTPVQVIDKGRPFWILQSAHGAGAGETERRRAVDEILDEVLRDRPAKISAAKLLEESRR